MQYVNLINPAFRPQRELLTIASLAGTLGAICIVLAAGHYFAKSRADDLQAPMAGEEAQLRAGQERLAVAGRAVASAKPDAKLVAEIETTRESLRVLDAAMIAVASGALGDTTGFSEQFRAFARQSADGLWLTGFTVAGAGKDIIVNGRALNAESVPAYIRRLRSEPAFQGRSFDVLMISEGKPDEDGGPAAAKQAAGKPGAVAPARPYLEFQLVTSAELAGKQVGTSPDLGAMHRAAEGKP